MTVESAVYPPSPHGDHMARWARAHAATLIPSTPTLWSRVDATRRSHLIYATWVMVELLLLAGLFDRRAFSLVVGVSFVHALVVLAMVGYRPLVFPAQVRVAYFAWVAVGTYVPGLRFMMYIALIGLAANLASGYCLMARTLYLLPWNREHALTPRLAWSTIFTRPGVGRFRLSEEIVQEALIRA